MTIILFLIDTSASMNQRTYLGARPTLLDVSKDAVEKFIKYRQRDPASRGDRYMLLTFEDPPANIKAGWKESHNVFMTELKNLTATGMTTMGAALKNAFDLLNLNRMQTGIDTYGMGRSPFYLEPSIIIAITDGGRFTSNSGVHEELNLPMHSNVPGSELTKEPFRWDQRLFSLVLRLTGTPPADAFSSSYPPNLPTDCSPIDAMCDVTGGRSYAVTSQRSLIATVESLVSRVQGGVVIQFEKFGPDPPVIIPDEEQPSVPGTSVMSSILNGTGHGGVLGGSRENSMDGMDRSRLSESGTPKAPPGWHSTRRLIYVQRSAQKGYSVGHWPIPESFWPDIQNPSLPPRTAHPILKFTCQTAEPMVVDNLPFDKYELEPSPLTQYILSRKQPQVAWQVFVAGSAKGIELGHPFGYLKASTALNCVNLFVMPYNYPVLLPLLDELFKVHHGKPTREWRAHFENYLKNMPLYYTGPLRRALQRMGAVSQNLVPEHMDNCLSYSVLNYLKRLKNTAKNEFDKLVQSVGQQKPSMPDGFRIQTTGISNRKLHDFNRTKPPQSNSSLFSRLAALKTELNDFPGFVVRIKAPNNSEVKTQRYRNPYDIQRHELLEQISRMRTNFLHMHPSQIKYQDEDQIHSLPVSQMGNYQDYLKRQPVPLRELEAPVVRQHMFGNPFKVDKKGMMVDEADIDGLSNSSGGTNNSGGSGSSGRAPKRAATPIPQEASRTKRRPGPLPKDFNMKTLQQIVSSPRSTPPASPCPSYSSTPPASPMPLTPPSSPSPANLQQDGSEHGDPIVKVEPGKWTPNEPLSTPTSKAKIKVEATDDTSSSDFTVIISSSSSLDQSTKTKPRSKRDLEGGGATSSDIISNSDSMKVNGAKSKLIKSEKSDTSGYKPGTISNSGLPTGHNHSISRSMAANSDGARSNNIADGERGTPVDTEEFARVKRELSKLIKKPGRDFTDLKTAVSEKISSNGFTREVILRFCVLEAMRFKRSSVVDFICKQFKYKAGDALSSPNQSSNDAGRFGSTSSTHGSGNHESSSETPFMRTSIASSQSNSNQGMPSRRETVI